MNNRLRKPETRLDMTTSHAFIYSYSPQAETPILIRHYDHLHTDPAGLHGYPNKILSTYTLFIFIEANLHFVIGDSIYTPSCGDIIILRKGEPYTFYFHSFSRVEYYQIDFPADFFTYLPPASPFHAYFSEQREAGSNMLMLNDTRKSRMFHILHKLEEQIAEQSKHCDFLNYACLIELGAILSDSYSNVSNQISAKSVPALREALQYINEYYLTIQSTEQIAKHCHISVSYLCRLFKKHLDITPVEYINSRKLSYAKYLLKNGANTTEACFAAGFHNYNYFITLFKNKTGQTPSEFKN